MAKPKPDSSLVSLTKEYESVKAEVAELDQELEAIKLTQDSLYYRRRLLMLKLSRAQELVNREVNGPVNIDMPMAQCSGSFAKY